jgi:PTS system mannitol-specific IIA component
MAFTAAKLRFLLPVSSVDLTATATDRADAVRQVGALLAAAGAVNPAYTQAMLDRENAVSTFVGDGIAMPHGTLTARSEVLAEGLALLRFADPIDWGGEPVTIVIGIAAHDRRYIALLSQLASALLDGERAAALRSVDNAEQVYSLLSN